MFRRLLLLNGLATLSVVLYHASAGGYISMFWWTHRYQPVSVPNFDQFGGLSYFGLRVVEQAIIFAIPAFLFVSGFFVSVAVGRSKTTIGWGLVWLRIKSLAVPFLLWSVLILAKRILLGESYTPLKATFIVLTGKIEPSFYYIPVLIQLYLLSPLLVPLAKAHWKALLFIAGLLQLSVLFLRYTLILGFNIPGVVPFNFLNTSWFFPGYIFSFSFGMVAGFHLPKFKKVTARLKWYLLAGGVLFFIGGIIEWENLLRLSGQQWIGPIETLVDQLYAFGFILSFFAFAQFNPPFPSHLTDLGGKSFGIYLIHSSVLEFTARTIFHFSPWVLAYQVLFQPILWIAGLVIPLILMALVNRSPGRILYGYVFG